MKAGVLAVALISFLGRCQHLPIPGAEPDSGTPDAGSRQIDAALPESDASLEPQPDAASAEVDAGAPDTCQGPPGLYADAKCKELSPGIERYTPRFELWADGATKERFIYLPEGAQIDTSNPNRWTFPVGTRLYKTFSMHGQKLETRIIEKQAQAVGDESWQFTAWVWSADQQRVQPADAAGMSDVLGTSHDIPSQAQCHTCHAQAGLDSVNGFGAVQLNHDEPGFNLGVLLARQRLVNGAGAAPNVSVELARLPGDSQAQAAIGYLHGNCAHCHGGPVPRAGLNLTALVGMATLADAPVYTASCACLKRWTGRKASDGADVLLRIAPGDARHSGIVARMSVRGAGEQMPPLGTELVDQQAVEQVSAWLDRLDSSACENPVCSSPAAAVGGAAAGAGAAGGAGSPANAGSSAP